MYRRDMLFCVSGLLVTPAIVRASSLMRLSFLSLIHDGSITEIEWLDGPHLDLDHYPYRAVQATFSDGYKERYPTGGVAFNQAVKRAVAQSTDGTWTVTGNGNRSCGIRFMQA